MVLTVSQTTNFRHFQLLKEFSKDNFRSDENCRKFLKWAENALGKGEIAHDEQFLLFRKRFLKMLSKDVYCRHVKTMACLGKG